MSSGQLLTACRLAWEGGGRLVALWVTDDRDRDRGFTVRVALEDADGLTVLEHSLPDADAHYPDVAAIFPAANRMQRAAFDLTGIAADSDDQRQWLWQACWPIDRYPLRRDFEASPKWEPGEEDYGFVRVEGDGVHEIPVGPVHAGIIEPGHFRFQIVGEKVLRLEERLGYDHKGIEKRFEALAACRGAPRSRAASRATAPSRYAWAYAQAAEAIAGVGVPPRAAWLRALALERERLANHLGDLGYLGNDCGFAFGLAQFSLLKEDVLRTNAAAFGHRMMMDRVVPGRRRLRISLPRHAAVMRDECTRLAREIAVLRDIYDEHAGLQDRIRACGIVTPSSRRSSGCRASRAARAASRATCAAISRSRRTTCSTCASPPQGSATSRRASPCASTRRWNRCASSASIVDSMPEGPVHAALPEPPPFKVGLGYVEGWRGPVFVALESGPDGSIRRCHPHDPSWSSWPVLEHAVIGNIVPDFPLINKSFNLSYSGHDL